jgi:hypothetical protein
MGNKHLHPSCIQLNLNFISMQMIDGETGMTEMQRERSLEAVKRLGCFRPEAVSHKLVI